MKIKKYAEMLIDNWPAKILSLAIAVFLFYFYKINSTEVRYISVPLAITMESSFTPAEIYPKEVRIRLRGGADTISIIHESDIAASAEFSRITEAGIYKVPVRIKRFGNALYADPLEIRVEPNAIELKIEEKLIKSLEIIPALTGYPDENHELTGYVTVPPRLTVEGPLSVIQNLNNLKTESINLAGRENNFTVTVKVDFNNPVVYFPEGNEVQFRGNVEKRMLVKTLAPLDIMLVNTDDTLTYELEVNSGSLRVEADRTLIEQIDRENSSLFIDLRDIVQPGVYNMPVMALVYLDADIISISPETVRLYVTRKGRF